MLRISGMQLFFYQLPIKSIDQKPTKLAIPEISTEALVERAATAMQILVGN